MEWKPIETAPVSDDYYEPTRILLWCADLRPTGRHRKDVAPVGPVFGYVFNGHNGCRAKGEGMLGDWTFTHWMPLPEPPQ